jgi:hypothetical protein
VAGALSRLALASTHLHPDAIPAVVTREAAAMGAADARIYLADMEQVTLIRFGGDDARIAIDGTVAGQAYRTERPVRTRTDDRAVVWLPLLDSAERFGVVAVEIVGDGDVDDAAVSEWVAFVNLVGELLANKSLYSDGIIRTRRTQAMTTAAELRWAMLPPLTYTGAGLSISGILEPAYAVAGDTFDYAINAGTAHVAIIDAVGHSLEAARIANLAVIAYRHQRRLDGDLVEKLQAMDTAVAEAFSSEKFATAQLVHLRLATGDLRWLNAGHPPPILVRGEERIDLESEICLPVGLGSYGTALPQVAEARLEPGDVLLFFTDGVIEARAPDGRQFGRDRLGDLLQQTIAGRQTPAETLRLLGHAVLEHQAGVLQDDATMVLVAWDGPPGPDDRGVPVPHVGQPG